MAAREHRVSRRVLLGAACAAPVLSAVEGLGRHPGLDPGSTSFSSEPARWIPGQARNDEKPVLSRVEGWDRALARCRQAEAILGAAAHEPDEDLYGDLVVAFSRALRRLLRTPVPDLPSLSLKIGLAIDHYAWELTGGEACMAALKRDARRLAFGRTRARAQRSGSP